MKKILIAICAALLLLAGTGCEKTIEFKGEETQPRLTVSSEVEAGQPLVVYVASSLFFLADEKGGAAFTQGLDTQRGEVRCYVNGGNEPKRLSPHADESNVSALRYVSDGFAPAPGDHLRLEAEFPGFDPVWAETTVPRMPAFEVISSKWHEMESGDWYNPFDDGEVYHALDLTMAVTDDPTYDKFYFVQPVLEQYIPYLEEVIRTSMTFTSNDVLFRQMSGSNAMQLVDGDGNYFSDELVKGQRREFTISISYVPEKEEDMALYIHVATVNENLYWYDFSYSLLMGDTGLFSEGVTLYSNVNGGYGVFGAAASKWLEVDW